MKKQTILKLAVGAAAALTLSACVTATPYQAQNGKITSYGYDDTRIEPGKYRVGFRGNSSTDRATVENYILLRAAELTVAEGFGHFVVLDEDEGSTSRFAADLAVDFAMAVLVAALAAQHRHVQTNAAFLISALLCKLFLG